MKNRRGNVVLVALVVLIVLIVSVIVNTIVTPRLKSVILTEDDVRSIISQVKAEEKEAEWDGYFYTDTGKKRQGKIIGESNLEYNIMFQEGDFMIKSIDSKAITFYTESTCWVLKSDFYKYSTLPELCEKVDALMEENELRQDPGTFITADTMPCQSYIMFKDANGRLQTMEAWQ